MCICYTLLYAPCLIASLSLRLMLARRLAALASRLAPLALATLRRLTILTRGLASILAGGHLYIQR